jgi:hypothetical protein
MNLFAATTPRWLPPLPAGCDVRTDGPNGAVFGRELADGHLETYRYLLWWDILGAKTADEVVVWVMLNPSTATETRLDPTLKRCAEFTKAAGGKAMIVANRFAFRSPYPGDLKRAADPIGPHNPAILDALEAGPYRIVVGWGVHGGLMNPFAGRRALWCLGTNDDGTPMHPLYVPGSRQLERWVPT